MEKWYYAYYTTESDSDWEGGFDNRQPAAELAESFMETSDGAEIGIVTLDHLIEVDDGSENCRCGKEGNLWVHRTDDNTEILRGGHHYMEPPDDCINTTDPTGRYIHEPMWVEFLIENGLEPEFEYQDIRWFPVDVIEGRWSDTIDDGTEYIGYAASPERGPNGHYYGVSATGDPRSGGDPGRVYYCTQLEEGTELGMVDCQLTDHTRFIGKVIKKDVVTEGDETNTYYEVEVDYERSVSARKEIDVHSRRPGIVGINDFEIVRVLNELPSADLIRRIRTMGEENRLEDGWVRPEDAMASMRQILNYLYWKEEADFKSLAGRDRSNHIFHHIDRVTRWLDGDD